MRPSPSSTRLADPASPDSYGPRCIRERSGTPASPGPVGSASSADRLMRCATPHHRHSEFREDHPRSWSVVQTAWPHHGLDSLAFVDERWTLRPVPERDAMLSRILEEPSAVTEGGFLGWTDVLIAAADHVIWLDPPLRVLVWRHVRRHWRHPWWLPSLVRFQVLTYLRPAGSGPARFDPDQTRDGIGRALRPLAYKVVRSARPVTADEVVEKLGLSSSPA